LIVKDIKGDGYEGIIKKEIPAIKYVNFEHSHFPMDTNQDENHEIEAHAKRYW
jgi:hypothetical protein